MNTGLLRSYIAPGAPATRTPCDGSEASLRPEFGFTPRWYHERLGVDFGERWHLDPLYRHQTVLAMRRELNKSFPSLRLGGDVEQARANLDGVHGALVVSQIFGIAAEYYPNNWPAARHEYLSEARIARLEVPSLPDTPVIAQILEQMEIIQREFGRVEGYLNWQGVLNNAYRLRGPEILSDIMLNPEPAHHLFRVVCETMIAGMRLIYGKQAGTGYTVRHATVSNCLVNMVSPETYREHLFQYDQQICRAFEMFGIHNCAWNVDPYIADYSRIQPLGYVDMGLESDLLRARELCPNTRRAVMYTPTDLRDKPVGRIREDLSRIQRELGVSDVVLADIDSDVDDEKVRTVAVLFKELNGH